jgi:hypothetical protein
VATPKVKLPVLVGVTHCNRCHHKLKTWFLFPVCDTCLDWEIQYLHSSGKSKSWMESR